MSPIPSIGSATTLIWDQEVFWPVHYRRNQALPDGITTNHGSDVKNRIAYTSVTETMDPEGVTAGVNAGGMQYTADLDDTGTTGQGFLLLRLGAPALAAPNYDHLCFPALAGQCMVSPVAGLNDGALWPSLARVYWLTAWIRWRGTAGTLVPDNRTGVTVMPVEIGDNTYWQSRLPPNNRGGVSICGDGAGQWQHCSWDRSGSLVLRYAQALPAHDITLWSAADFVFVSSQAAQAATFQFWFNGELITTRDWLGTDLERPVGYEYNWQPNSRNMGGDGDLYEMFHMRQGRFLPTGVELV